MAVIDPWDESAGALIHHGIELKRGVNIRDHLHRAKMRIIELEILFKEDVPREDLPAPMILLDACMLVYNKYPFSDEIISGKEFAAQVNLLRGKLKSYPDSVFKKMREIRNGEHPPLEVSWVNVDSPKKSLYKKPRPSAKPEEFVQETISFEE